MCTLEREAEDKGDTVRDAKYRSCVIVVICDSDSVHTSSPSDGEQLLIFASEHQGDGFCGRKEFETSSLNRGAN